MEDGVCTGLNPKRLHLRAFKEVIYRLEQLTPSLLSFLIMCGGVSSAAEPSS